MPEPAGSVAQLPFPRRPVDELLAFDSDDLDLDHAVWGHARVLELELADADDSVTVLRAPLVVALHGADDQPEGLVDDIVLEFVGAPDEPVYHAKLSRFLERHLASALGNESDVVLAVCNPNAARVRRVASLGDRRLHYAEGPVDSWCIETDGLPARIRLAAARWHTLIPRENR